MTIRTVLTCAAALVVSAASASAQGKAAKPVVISQAVMKSMMANKPKSKSPLGARAGIGRKSSIAPAQPVHAGPTSVRAASPIQKKK